MGYSTGTSTGPNDLIDKLRVFLEAEGWTTNDFSVDGTGYRLHVQKTASDSTVMYFNFRSAIAESGVFGSASGGFEGDLTGIGICGSLGYDALLAWNLQPTFCAQRLNDASYGGGNVIAPLSTSAIPAYYFFAIGDSIHVVVEGTSGIFSMMSFGMIKKQGVYTGGQYITASHSCYRWKRDYYTSIWGETGIRYMTINQGSYWDNTENQYVYMDVDGTANWRLSKYGSTSEIKFSAFSGTNTTTYRSRARDAFSSVFGVYSPNSYNNIASMSPIYVWLRRSDANYSLLGWPEGVRFLNTLNYSSGQELTYGTETWKVFKSNAIDGGIFDYDPNVGFAFKKVV